MTLLHLQIGQPNMDQQRAFAIVIGLLGVFLFMNYKRSEGLYIGWHTDWPRYGYSGTIYQSPKRRTA